MKCKINYLAAAQNDLLNIAEYISDVLGNPSAARRQIKLIRDAIEYAAESPYMYPVCCIADATIRQMLAVVPISVNLQ